MSLIESARIWRNFIPVHPAALMMRRYTEAEFEILCHDIETHGMLVPPVVYRDLVEFGSSRSRW